MVLMIYLMKNQKYDKSFSLLLSIGFILPIMSLLNH